MLAGIYRNIYHGGALTILNDGACLNLGTGLPLVA